MGIFTNLREFSFSLDSFIKKGVFLKNLPLTLEVLELNGAVNFAMEEFQSLSKLWKYADETNHFREQFQESLQYLPESVTTVRSYTLTQEELQHLTRISSI